jgi:predicted RNA-binding protein
LIFLQPTLVKALTGEFEYQLDSYYTALNYNISLTSAPIPYFEPTKESDIYKHLLLSPQLPRFMVLEASVNPLPILGVYLRDQASRFYSEAQINDEVNLVRSVTAGFEEPWALSLFMGNVIDFRPVKKKKYAEGKGYIGFLVSGGGKHIKDNELISDDWLELEWKLKGEKFLKDTSLIWSFRLGAKFHSHPDIADVYYVGLRRSMTDFLNKKLSWLKNTGAMYRYDVNSRGLSQIQHYLLIDKKFPLKSTKIVPLISVGFIYRDKAKYRGTLQDPEHHKFQFLLQPNIEF